MTYAFDPELAAAVPSLPSSSLEDPVSARAWLRELMSRAPAPDVSRLEISDRSVPGPSGAPDVPVRIYRPENAAGDCPAVLFMHGGGFVVGDLDTEHAVCVATASRAGAVVVSVDYRLAPEHPFPAGVEDCYAALRWLHAAAAQLGVDRRRIALHGRSAGGGLAAALALVARDRGGPKPCFQLLAFPILDDSVSTASARTFVDTPLLDRRTVELSWRHYLGDRRDDVSPYAAPARALDLRGLPPAYVLTMEFDPLRDEGIEYALRLLRAGVSVELHSTPGTFHGSGLIATAAISRRADAEQLIVLRRALGLDDHVADRELAAAARVR
jgi:acetyl esterase